jgi:hypothetical protein
MSGGHFNYKQWEIQCAVKSVLFFIVTKDKKMKVVINTCYGGFGLSEASLEEYKKRAGITDPNFSYWQIPRDNEHLVAMVEEGVNLDYLEGQFAELKIVEVPDDVNWYIEEYDGMEHVAERHRTWS